MGLGGVVHQLPRPPLNAFKLIEVANVSRLSSEQFLTVASSISLLLPAKLGWLLLAPSSFFYGIVSGG